MALSNKDKISRGLDALALGLRPFVNQHLGASAPDGDWVRLLEARDAQRHGAARDYSADDPRFLLKVVTEEWRAFGGELSRVTQSYASELRDAGNKFAHGTAFSADDTTRALDTMERLLTDVHAPEQAAVVNALRVEHQRATFEEQTRKTVRAAVGTVATPGTGLKPWREVITPHDDVARGQFNAAEFAADLHQVATGQTTQREYSDPQEFFARTYLTEGLKDLLDRAVRRMSGDDNASPVVNLQTNFGGGKTHSMLAVYHLFSGLPASSFPQVVQDVVADGDLASLRVRKVALVGTHMGPNQPRIKDDGTEVNTLWGELAWQLGGRAAYDRIAESDRSGTPPGDALTALIRDHAPVLVLIDEWVAYARGLSDEKLAGGRFEDQFTFAQSLTEAVSAVSGAMLLVSIPASDSLDGGDAASTIEIGGERGRRALVALQNVVGRKADHWRPASSVESFEIVRRRLFREPDAGARTEIAAVARQFVNFYRENHGQFPSEAEDQAYEDRLRAAYPIHPELFDRLYTDWSTLERFQRTRGVLRLMSTVIHELWSSNDASPLILPGSVPLHAARVASELTNYLPDSWKPIIDKDIDGEGSTPVQIDASRPGTFGARSLTRRIAREIFLASAPTLGTDHKGVERPRVWLGVAIPGDTVGNFGASLEVLGQQATYLYADNARYWFSTTASVTRTASDIADRLRDEPERVWQEVIRRLKPLVADKGLFAGVHHDPRDSSGVPDLDQARLVVVPPSERHTRGDADSPAMTWASDAMLRVGTGQRRYRNALVFLAADGQRWDDLDASVRDFLAWDEVDRSSSTLNLTAQQAAQATARRRQTDEDATNRIAGTFTWALVPEQPDAGAPPALRAERIADASSGLAARVSDKLRRGGELAADYGAAGVRMALDGPLAGAWTSGHIAVGELWNLYAQYPYLDRLRDRGVLERALLSGLSSLVWQLEAFALAEGYDETAGRYRGVVLPGDLPEPMSLSDGWLVVKPEIAAQQRAEESTPPPIDTTPGPGPSDPTTTTDDTGPVTPPPPPAVRVVTRYFGSTRLDPQRYGRDFARIQQEVLQHLEAAAGTRLEVSIEIQAVNGNGFSTETVRTVRENAATLRFEANGFEES